jgi:K+-transporting ATPase KdpF subunit
MSGADHAGPHLSQPRHRLLRGDGALCARRRTALEEAIMLEPILGLVIAVAIGIYLLATLIRPERF